MRFRSSATGAWAADGGRLLAAIGTADTRRRARAQQRGRRATPGRGFKLRLGELRAQRLEIIDEDRAQPGWQGTRGGGHRARQIAERARRRAGDRRQANLPKRSKLRCRRRFCPVKRRRVLDRRSGTPRKPHANEAGRGRFSPASEAERRGLARCADPHAKGRPMATPVGRPAMRNRARAGAGRIVGSRPSNRINGDPEPATATKQRRHARTSCRNAPRSRERPGAARRSTRRNKRLILSEKVKAERGAEQLGGVQPGAPRRKRTSR
jgi:hypothetical protein